MERQQFSATAPLTQQPVLVEASAGTGKTYGITNLVLRLVAEKAITVDRILVVTFTDAATSELRDRVRKRLVGVRDLLLRVSADSSSGSQAEERDRKALLDDDVLRMLTSSGFRPVTREAWSLAPGDQLTLVTQRLSAAVRDLDAAPISTIHGFCSEVLRTRAFESRAQLESELLEDNRELLERIVDDHLTRTLYGVDDARCSLLVDGCKMTRSRLLKLADKAARWPHASIEPEGEDLDSALADWTRDAQALKARWDGEEGVGARAKVVQAAKGCVFEGNTYSEKNTDNYANDVSAFLSAPAPLEILEHLKKRDKAPAWVRYFSPSQLSQKSKGAFRHDLFDDWQKLIERPHELLGIAAASFARRVRADLLEQLSSSGKLTFDSLLRQVRDAIVREQGDGPLTLALRKRYDAALIDEFQDTDDVQWPIFDFVFRRSGRHYLFLIGDPKQAIYRFRGADIQVYSAAKQSIGPFVSMADNYRSDPPCVEALNVVFDSEPDPFQESAFSYERVAPKKPKRLHFPQPRAALQLRWLDAQTRPAGLQTAPSSAEEVPGILDKGIAKARIPGLVVHEVQSLLRSGATVGSDSEKDRKPIDAGDIAILVRTNKQARQLHRALRSADVPAIVSQAGSVFDTDEARTLEFWLDAVASPSREAPTRLLALTPMLGWTARELDTAARSADEESLTIDEPPAPPGTAVVPEPPADDVAEAEGPDSEEGAPESAEQQTDARDWRKLRLRVAQWGASLTRSGFYSTFRRALEQCGTMGRLASMPDGERRLTDLRHVMELLHEVSVRERLDAPGLVRWLRAQRSDTELEEERTLIRLESDAKATKLVTLHKSKGLQYPIVLIPYAWDGALLHPDDETFVLYHEGPEVRIDVRLGGPIRDAHLRRAEAEAWRENMRVMYVGLTRAEHHVVAWWGPVKDSEQSAFGALLHGRRTPDCAAADRRELAIARLTKLEEGKRSFGPMLEDLRQLSSPAHEGSPLIEVSRLPPTREDATPSTTPEPLAPEGRVFQEDIDRSWRRMSYTSLSKSLHDKTVHPGLPLESVAGSDDDNSGREYDRMADEQPVGVPIVEVPSDQYARLRDQQVGLSPMRSGTEIGKWVHKVFEKLDFTTLHERDGAKRELARLVEDLGRRMGITDPKQHALLTEHLPGIVQTPFCGAFGDFGLKDIGCASRLDELSFDLPVRDKEGHSVPGKGIAAAIRANPDLPEEFRSRLGNLDEQRLAGMLTGSIDLAFQCSADKRWYVADYKTNRISVQPPPGVRERISIPACYEVGPMQAEMDRHAYYLQLHLYLVALHRMLKSRLPGYRYEKDVGGALYLFVRGMGGPGTATPDGHSRGVYFLRPDGDLIESLSEALSPWRNP